MASMLPATSHTSSNLELSKEYSNHIEPKSLNEMGEIHKEEYAASKWGYEPAFQNTHDRFIPQKSFKELEYKVPILNYLRQSLSLLDNPHKPRQALNKEEQALVLRRPLPLHRQQVVLRDLLTIEIKGDMLQSSKNNYEKHITYKDIDKIDEKLNDSKEAEKDSFKDQDESINEGKDPVFHHIIPSASVDSSEESDSDSDSVSIVAFDLKETTLDDDSDVENVSYDDYVTPPPKPAIKKASLEFFVPTGSPGSNGETSPENSHGISSRTTNRGISSRNIRGLSSIDNRESSQSFINKNVYPKIELLSTSPVIKGTLGRQKQAHVQLSPKMKLNLSTPSVVNVGRTELGRDHTVSACSDRTLKTRGYFMKLGEKEKEREVHSKKIEEKKTSCEEDGEKEISSLAMITTSSDTEKGSEKECEKVVLAVEIPNDDSECNENCEYKSKENSCEEKTKINGVDYIQNVLETNRSAQKVNKHINSESTYAIHYLTGSEIHEKRLIPCESKKLKRIPNSIKNIPINRNSKTEKRSDSNRTQVENARKLKSAPARTIYFKKQDMVNNQNKIDKKVPTNKSKIKTGNTPPVKKEEKSIPTIDLIKLVHKGSVRKKRNSLKISHPPMTAVSISNYNKNKSKVDSSLGWKPCTVSIPSPPKTARKIKPKQTKEKETHKSVSNKIIDFPAQHMVREDSPNTSFPYRKVRNHRIDYMQAVVNSSIDRFKHNEYRTIQNHLKDDDFSIPVDVIKKVLTESKENNSESLIVDKSIAISTVT